MVWLVATMVVKKFEDMFSCFDVIPACGEQTGGQADRRTDISRQHSPRYP